METETNASLQALAGERFVAKVAVGSPDECWPWRAAVFTQTGYGVWHPIKGVTTTPHRWLYQLLHGPIPTQVQVDHECHNRDTSCAGGPSCLHRRCVNPAHLIARAGRDNANASPNANVHKTHCPKDHPYTAANTYVCGRGTRRCRECARIRDRARSPRTRNRKAA